MPRARYGLDAPSAVFFLVLSAVVTLVGAWSVRGVFQGMLSVSLLFAALGLFLGGGALLLGSVVWKLRERDWLLEHLPLKGHECGLDVGCGRGLLLVGLARKLVRGRVVGVDLWSQKDQLGNDPAATLKTLRSEGVASRTHVITGDARALPFCAEAFQVVVSSWALHNLPTREHRQQALHHIHRVLAPGGRVALLDIFCTQEYEAYFSSQGYTHVRRLGPRLTFGFPLTYLVCAQKP